MENPLQGHLPGEFHGAEQCDNLGLSQESNETMQHCLSAQSSVHRRRSLNAATDASHPRSQCLTWKFHVVCSCDRHTTQRVTNTVPLLRLPILQSHALGVLSVSRGTLEALRIHPVVSVKPELLNLSTMGVGVTEFQL